MKPSHALREPLVPDPGRRFFLKSAAVGLIAMGGCAKSAVRSQSPEDIAGALNVRLVSELAVAHGTYPVKIEAVGLISGLPGGGSDPGPSPQRAALLDEMQKRGVAFPNQVLASPTTELVVVRAFLRPGIQKGDRFDVEVRVPSRSEATSLRGGWLMETRLREMAVLKNSVREGKVVALAEGALLVDPSAEGDDERVKLTRGRILGGGVALDSRKIGLVLKPNHQNVANSALVGAAVNRRFHSFTAGIKQGVANPKDDTYIELTIHPRYKDNIERFIQVVRALPVRETAAQQLARLALLERQLLDPITAADASLRLEAIGKEAIKSLEKGVASPEAEVRFYAAEALAYLDESSAIIPLAAAARDVPAFRAYALAALSAMDDFGAYDALRELLDVASAETRYGAFRALWAMNPQDPLVRGEMLGGQFSYHLLESKGPPMVHATRSYRAEIVLFGHDQRFVTPAVLEAGKEIMINAQSDEQVTISRFAPGKPDQKRVVTSKVDEVIRAVVELGGTYPDVVQVLQQARAAHALTSRFEVDAIPAGGRTYDRVKEEGEGDEESGGVLVANPLPGLFATRDGKSDDDSSDKKPKKKGSKSTKKSASKKSFFGRIAKRDK